MAKTNGNPKANGNGRPTAQPDAPTKRARMGERTGGQSRRGTGSGNAGGGRSGLDPIYGSFDLNPAQPFQYPPQGTFEVGGNGLTGVVKGANTLGSGPWTYTPLIGQLPGYREPSPGDYCLYREMDGNPTLALAKAVVCGPILSSTWSFEGDEDTPPQRIDFIRDMLDPMRTPLVTEMLRALSTGWRPFEKIFDIKPVKGLGDMIWLHKAKPLLPDYTKIVVVKATGAFDGLVQDFSTTKTDKVVLPVNKSFVYTYDGEAGDFYGRSRHENARRIYPKHEDASKLAGQLGTKVSSVIPIVKFPPGESRTNDEDAVNEAREFNRRIAQAIVDNLTVCKGIAFETESVDSADLRANPKLAELTRWAVETLQIGSSGEALASLITEREYFDKLLFRAWLVPERVALEGTHGTLAEAEAHADISLTDSELLHDDIVRYINWYIIDEILAMNFGEDARGTVWITPSPIVDSAKANIKKIFEAWLGNPATLEIITSETDRAAVYEQLEIPADASGGMDAEGKPTGPGGDPVADVFARARGAQDDPQAQDDAAAEDEAASAIAAAMTLAANCGTGAGGFQPGNDCARGGDGSGTGDVDDAAVSRGIVDALKGGGISYQPIEGSSPIVGYAVSPFKGMEMVRDSADAMSVDDVIAYIKAARDAAKSDPRVHVGGWVDDRTGKAYLDLSVVVTDQAEAERIARSNDQEAYYDVAKQQTIFTKPLATGHGHAGASLSADDRRGVRSARARTTRQGVRQADDAAGRAAAITLAGQLRDVASRAVDMRGIDAIPMARQLLHAADELVLNCGTGAGGFQPGNTCATGGSGADDERHIVNPIDRTAKTDEKVRQLQALSAENEAIVKRIIARIDGELGTKSKFSHKAAANIASKAQRPSIRAEKPWFDVEHVRDALRFKTVLNDFTQVPAILKIIQDEGAEIVKLDTKKMLKPKEWGWRFVAFDLRMPNGQLVEHYMPLAELEKAKKDANHLIFEKWRNKTPEQLMAQRAEFQADLQESHERYDQGWRRSLDRLGMSQVQAENTWNNIAAGLHQQVQSRPPRRRHQMRQVQA